MQQKGSEDSVPIEVAPSTMTTESPTQQQQRTPRPSDWEHAKILMKKNLRVDCTQRRLVFVRTFIGPLMLLLWTFGIFFNYPDQNGTATSSSSAAAETASVGDYIFYPGENWTYPASIVLAVSEDSIDFEAEAAEDFLSTMQSLLDPYVSSVQLLNETSVNGNATSEEECNTVISGSSDTVCVSFLSASSYHIIFDGMPNTELSPSHPVLAGTQQLVNTAILNASGVENLYDANNIQHTPDKVFLYQKGKAAPTGLLITPGMLLSLAFAIGGMFVLGPMVNEKLQLVVDSLLLVGVKRRVYMLQWVAYYSLSSGILTAIALTLVSIFWNLYPMSNAGLIFLSHYLAIVQFNLMASFISQIVNQEELATGLPWLLSFVSMAIAAPLILLDTVRWLLFIFSAVLPYVAAMTYSAIYTNYDVWGWNTGVHPGSNVAESGILAVTVAQIVGIGLWICTICVYSHLLERRPRNSPGGGESISPERSHRKDAFEDLPSDADVVLSMRDVLHTYPGSGYFRKTDPTPVLKGFDLDVCRGECFGFLGHNGAGKTTTIKVATGELHLQGGQVTYNFAAGGSVQLSDDIDISNVQANIGVCPQGNIAIGKFTARETLDLFASLKGRVVVDEGQSYEDAIAAEVQRRIQDLKFEEGIVDKPVETLSGGMKRKVAIATALLGDPQVIFLDEPTAGCDPFSRRQVWELIIRSKQGRCIVLTSHFLDEVDVLSDRVGILSQGQMMTCGSSLFLKHHFGVGYSLTFCSSSFVDISAIVVNANDVSTDEKKETGEYSWELPHGTEPVIPEVLRALGEADAKDISLDITTLEQVFLATESEAQALASAESDTGSDESSSVDVDQNVDVENVLSKEEHIARIWDKPSGAQQEPMTFWKRLILVQRFLMGNAFKMKGAIFLNIVQPMIYLVAVMVVVRVVGVPEQNEVIQVPDDIQISSSVLGAEESSFFGVDDVSGPSVSPLVFSDPPDSVEFLFANGTIPTAGGYWDANQTLQYNATRSSFALQVGAALLSNSTLWLQNGGRGGISTTLSQLPYTEYITFRIDLLLAPMGIAFGFIGMAYCVLDALLLKSKNNFELFRVVGITEWTTNLGIVMYKGMTSFCPFFVLVLALGFGLQSVLFGSAGRWLGTILLLITYAFSIAPLGLIFATVLTDYKSVSQWFPGVFMMAVSLPYTAWVLVLQLVPNALDTVLLVGDILCIIPTFAFQRGLGAVIYISPKYSDENLSWGEVWSWQARIWFAILMMFVVGALEWLVLFRRSIRRPRATKLAAEDAHAAAPVDTSTNNEEVEEERKRSEESNSGIRARELVKTFYAAPLKRRGKKRLKKAVAGVSFGVEPNQIFAVVGPNGAGKSVTLSMLSGELRPDHGDVVLDGECAKSCDKDTTRLFSKSSVSYTPQFDSLFDRKTTAEHLEFYARVRGLDTALASTQDHISSIVEMMGLKQHLSKESTALSGGFKRRLSLAISLLGYPRCIMLDEVTTGMSPDARHRVWDVLRHSDSSGNNHPSILLSTHYMDEASELGSRIAIMIDGQLKAVGSLRSLQDKYCHSYFVEIALENHAPKSAQDDILAAFDVAGLPAEVYESSYFLRFKMKVPLVSSDPHARLSQLADIFTLLHYRQKDLFVKFYSVAQMTLEQIFIDFCRRQFEVEESWRQENVAVEETS